MWNAGNFHGCVCGRRRFLPPRSRTSDLVPWGPGAQGGCKRTSVFGSHCVPQFHTNSRSGWPRATLAPLHGGFRSETEAATCSRKPLVLYNFFLSALPVPGAAVTTTIGHYYNRALKPLHTAQCLCSAWGAPKAQAGLCRHRRRHNNTSAVHAHGVRKDFSDRRPAAVGARAWDAHIYNIHTGTRGTDCFVHSVCCAHGTMYACTRA